MSFGMSCVLIIGIKLCLRQCLEDFLLVWIVANKVSLYVVASVSSNILGAWMFLVGRGCGF